MQLGTWIMLIVCVVWVGLFIRFTIRDLRDEGKKSAIITKGKSLDPFMFSGERARAEAKELYERDPLVKQYFDKNEITPFLYVKEKEDSKPAKES